jgi:alanyl-tRNA synthetase
MAAEAGLTVDEQGFRTLMAEQRSRAKADAAAHKHGYADGTAYRAVLDAAGGTTFLGYTDLVSEAQVVGLVVDGVGVPAAGAGTAVEVILDRTPFYAEGGGQLADTGWIRGSDNGGGFVVDVTDVQSPVTGLVVHRGTVREGEITAGAAAQAQVDIARRAAISRSHSATHLVHAGMRKALGDAAAQAGSLNAPGRLRFDFTSPSGAVPTTVLADVEDEVNDVLLNDHEVRAFVTTQDEARRIGAMALFGEKYGDEVRVVEIGDYSRELCGGTHVARSGQLGLVKLLSEASIGSGVRRVEALVGLDAFRFLAKEHVLVSQLAEQFKAKPEELPERIGGVVERLRQAERELEKVRADAVLSSAGALADSAEDVGGTALVAAAVPGGVAPADLRALASDVRGRLGARPGVVALFGADDAGKVSFVVATTAAARDAGLAAGKLVPVFAPAVGGRGGGKPDLAQGGGTDPSGVAAAIDALRRELATR